MADHGTTLDGDSPGEAELGATDGGHGSGSEREHFAARYPPGTQVGRYVVLDQIGAGAMGVVLASYDPDLNRKVALKLLVPRSGRSAGPSQSTRLLREAQAIARLSHPNVVNVYEVGRHDDAVFLAMEFVDGVPLTQWLGQPGRSLVEVLRVFAQAGQGLQAAHAAGLVHRDFKPDNVLVSEDGRARVLDFGLARADPARYSGSVEPKLLESQSVSASLRRRQPLAPAEDLPESKQANPERGVVDPPVMGDGVPTARVWADSDVLNTSLTRDDTVVGTPGFMAPEQHSGDPPDARSDQYSFCVALYSALYQQPPFAGRTLRQLAAAKHAGNVAPIPKGSTVPLWVEEAVLRGLFADPRRRWPTMQALVATLSHEPRAKRGRWTTIAGSAALLAVIMAGVGYQQGTAERPCQGSAAHTDEVWSETDRGQISSAIAATGLPFADHTRGEIEQGLDDYALRWQEAHRDACEATSVRGEQSGGMLDRRMACLQQRLDAMEAFVDIMAVADDAVVGQAVQAMAALPGVAACDDTDRLTERVALPADDATRRIVATVEAKLAQAKVLRSAGKASDALELARQALREAQATDYRPVVAAASEQVGVLLEATGEYVAAEAPLQSAMLMALRVGDTERAASAATTLASVVGDRLARYDAGLLWGAQAEALLERVGDDGLARARLDNVIGNVLYRQGDTEGARARYGSALAGRERISGAHDAQLGLELINFGNVQLADDDYEGALATFARSQRIIATALGEGHPKVMFAVLSSGVVHQEQGHFAEARERFATALPVMARAMGDKHPFVAVAALNLGNAQLELGDLDGALASLAQAEAIYRAAFGPQHPDMAQVAVARAKVLIQRKDDAAARADLNTALQIRSTGLGHDHVSVGEVLLELGKMDRREGDLGAAVQRIQESTAIFEAADAPNEVRAAAHAAASEAMWDAGEPASAARSEAEFALELLRGLGPSVDEQRASLRAWLLAHPVDAARAPVKGADDD